MFATNAHAVRNRRRAGFTLVELMVVMVILVVLMGIGLAVANQVTQGGRIRTTQSLIRTLDQTMAQYQGDTGKKISGVFRDAVGNEFPLFDGRVIGFDNLDQPATPSQAFYMAVLRESPGASKLLTNIDSAFVERVPAQFPDLGVARLTPQPPTAQPPIAQPANETVVIVKDAWGEPIRFVHPKWHGGYGNFYRQDPGNASSFIAESPVRDPLRAGFRNGNRTATLDLRRSALPRNAQNAGVAPNSDGWQTAWKGDGDEGLCPGGLPYFYSSGPDKDPGRRGDNVYTTQPTFTAESMSTSGN
jgi:prepilin-type N-terminal cleavage/methylation domain-containing protein